MKKFLLIFSLIILVLFVTGFIWVQVVAGKTEDRLSQKYDLTITVPDLSGDSTQLMRGEKWARALCADCHGDNLGGQLFIDDPALGQIYAPNLTRGKGGLAYYTDENWVKAIRHGVAATGRPLIVMPSKDYNNMTREDLAAVIAFMKQAPAIDQPNGATELSLLAKVLLYYGQFGDAVSVEVIDHERPVQDENPNLNLMRKGQYLVEVAGCATCHGQGLRGGVPPDPDSPFAPDLSPGGNIKTWKEADFLSVMRRGTTPEGKVLQDKFMPWLTLGRLPDEDLKAMFVYLKSIPAKEMQ